EIGRFTWKNLKLAFIDRATPGAGQIDIDDAGIEIRNLQLDRTSKAGDEKSATIRAWLTAPALVPGGLTIDGTLTPGPQILAAELKIRAEKIHTAALAPYLKPLGI